MDILYISYDFKSIKCQFKLDLALFKIIMEGFLHINICVQP